MQFSNQDALKEYLDELVSRFNHPGFIELDPISVPHRFSKREDIEVSGFFAAVLAWGQRKTILNKMQDLLERMDFAPGDFIRHHSEKDLQKLEGFIHRTFNDTDLLYFIHFLKDVYRDVGCLEKAFFPFPDKRPDAVFHALVSFRKRFAESPFYPPRTGKHISTPQNGSACKRLNMFLRWMLRKDDAGVDFGIWNSIQPAQLICPCDVHVERQARMLGLVSRPKADWAMACELTENLRQLNPEDPVRYDFALFGLGVNAP
jgi:uncharacterized protein (TIGR02757 family)